MKDKDLQPDVAALTKKKTGTTALDHTDEEIDSAYEELRKKLKLMQLTPLQMRKMSPSEIMERADKEIKGMLIEALAIKKHDLRYGDEKVKRQTASEVLAMNGLDKKEAAVAGAGSIVINIGSGNTPTWFRSPAVAPQDPSDGSTGE